VRHHASSARSMGWHLTIATKRGVHTASPKLRILSSELCHPPDARFSYSIHFSCVLRPWSPSEYLEIPPGCCQRSCQTLIQMKPATRRLRVARNPIRADYCDCMRSASEPLFTLVACACGCSQFMLIADGSPRYFPRYNSLAGASSQ
jgi:hypothetical protein